MNLPLRLLTVAMAVSLTGAARAVQDPLVPPDVQARPATGAISGRVSDAQSGQVLPGVVVSLRPPPGSTTGPLVTITRQLTDALGRFAFRALPAGDGYTLTATRTGYVDGEFGQTAMLSPAGRITLGDGQWLSAIDIRMWKPGAISGRVLDEFGEPMVGVYVRALARHFVAGRAHLLAGPVALTDDRGDYRIANLPPASYVVQVPSVQTTVPTGTPRDTLGGSATPSNERPLLSLIAPKPRTDAALDAVGNSQLVVGNYATPPLGADGTPQAYPMAFFPTGSSHATAQSIDVGLGEERNGIDLSVFPVPATAIFGVVSGPRDAIAGLVLRLMPAGLEDLSTGGEAATALVGGDGSFAFLNVPAGSYVIDAPRTTLELTYQAGASSVALPGAPGVRLGGAQSGAIASGPPGAGYTRRSGQGDDLYWARTAVTVGPDGLSNVVVPLNKSHTLTGRFVYEGTTRTTIESIPVTGGGIRPATPAQVVQPPPPRPDRTPTIYAQPADGSPSLGLPRSASNRPNGGIATDAFRIEGLKGGEYVLRVPFGLGRYTVKSITVGGADYTHRPIDAELLTGGPEVVVTLTDKITTVTGLVRDDTGMSDAAAVIAFPAEPEQWTRYGLTPARIRSVPVAGTTGYAIRDLPAGDYYLVAVDPTLVTAWQDPKFLERAAAVATRVTLAWDDSKTVELTKVRIK